MKARTATADLATPAVARSEKTVRLRVGERVVEPPQRPLGNSALWLISSNVTFAGCQWGAIVALAKLGAPEGIGHLGLALAVATPVVMVTGFALRSYQATDVLGYYSFADYLQLRLAANVVGGAIIAAAGMFGRLGAAAIAILIPIGAAKFIEATSETCYGLAQRHDRMRFIAISKAVRGALGLGALVAVVASGGSLAAGSWALAAAWAAFLLAVDLPFAATLEPPFARPRFGILWRLARESAPLGAVNGVFAVGQNVPRYLLQLSHGAAAVGYYTALSSMTPALSQLATSVCHAAAPRLGWHAAGDQRQYRRFVLQLLGWALAVAAVLTVSGALGGRPFLTLAYAPDYAGYHAAFVIVILAAGLALVNEVLGFAMIAARKQRTLLAVQCLGLLTMVGASATLIPSFGVNGAALAAAVTTGVTVVAGARVVLARRAAC